MVNLFHVLWNRIPGKPKKKLSLNRHEQFSRGADKSFLFPDNSNLFWSLSIETRSHTAKNKSIAENITFSS